MNKKGYSVSGWFEGIALILLFVGVFGYIISDMNLLYGKDHQVGLGEQANGTTQALIGYQGGASGEIRGGEAEFTSAQGLTLKSSWNILKSIFGVITDFFTGGFIETIVNYMRLPALVATIFRLLWCVSVIFAIITVLFRRQP